jgi:hypothetical protein
MVIIRRDRVLPLILVLTSSWDSELSQVKMISDHRREGKGGIPQAEDVQVRRAVPKADFSISG